MSLIERLYQDVMKHRWDGVIEAYKHVEALHTAKLVMSGDTALHLAISSGKASVAKVLVDIVCQTKGALTVMNNRGNTALHLAAQLGDAGLCHCIASHDTRLLMGIRNCDGSTPLFVATLHGRKEAFYALHSICVGDEGYSYCRGRHGDTILHAALEGGYFDLACDIMTVYSKLVDACNENGVLPLHILANKPSAFESGSKIRGIAKFIYHCIFVDAVPHSMMPNQAAADLQYKEDANYPENYHTCLVTFSLLWNILRRLLIVLCGNRSRTAERRPYECDKKEELTKRKGSGHEILPKNYVVFVNFVKLISKPMLAILGIGSKRVAEIKEKKTRHFWSIQILGKLLNGVSNLNQYDGRCPAITANIYNLYVPPIMYIEENLNVDDASESSEIAATSDAEVASEVATPILDAAKNGILEMVAGILDRFPLAIHDKNVEGKNVVLIAVQYRQPHVYKFLLDWDRMRDTILLETDKDGNSALHLAARIGEYKPWLIPGHALLMQWELKWYKFVKKSMPDRPARNGPKTPREIFYQTHDGLAKEAGKWLTSTSQSCSVVASLIATVAFSTSATVPGGGGENETAFSIFAISSLLALCFSVTSLIMFLAILTSKFQQKDFGTNLPRKLLVGLTSLFVSIGSMLLSFCACNFMILKNKVHYPAFPFYLVACLPVILFAVNQFPWYFDLLWITARSVPQRSPK